MSGIFSLVGASDAKPNPYAKIGLSRNPFRPQDDMDQDGPFYAGHLQRQLTEIIAWLDAAEVPRVPALSIRGTVGVGKSRLLREIRKGLAAEADSRKCFAWIIELGEAGFTRPSVGQLLLDAVELVHPTWDQSYTSCPEEVIPLIWCIAASAFESPQDTLVGRALYRAQCASGDQRKYLVRSICRWLRRHPLTPKQSEDVGLYGRIDVSGALPDAMADVLDVAAKADILRHLYFMVDQLEELFRDAFSQLQRSRILTDLRMLIDREDKGPGLKLVLTWGPERPGHLVSNRDEVEERMKLQYSALHTRLVRNMIAMDQLSEPHALPFTEKYLNPVREESGSKSADEPLELAEALASDAWLAVTKLPSGQRPTATPRDFLRELAVATDRRVGLIN